MTNQRLIKRVAERYQKLCEQHHVDGADPAEVVMSVAIASDDMPLDLQQLLNFRDPDFAHDVGGILRHIDIVEWRLDGRFTPRCAGGAS